ncbi:MAG: methyltransferase domain-containing protein [Burkholderiales bacterium]|nr:methyltransferase domain-containing protein [Burkholderiales bacterium]
MRLPLRHALLTASFIAALLPGLAAAQAKPAAEFVPQVGQAGKDVIWVPTPKSLVEKMLKMAEVKPGETLYDLGSGDGITVITAAKQFGAVATGIEYNPDMVELSKRNAQKEGVGDKAQFIRGDIFATDFSKASVVTMYLLPYLNLKLRPTILDMKPGTRVVSHAFTMDDWAPDQVDSSEGRTAYLWIVPAKVEGTWKMDKGSFELKQKFQEVSGVYRTGDGLSYRVTATHLRGDQISFAVGSAVYTGRVSGPVMQGTMRAKADAPATSWSATLVK